MPNPKTQTVTFDLTAAINELKKGRVEFRSDKTGVMHLAGWPRSHGRRQITENVHAVSSEVEKRRPADTKGEFVQTVAVSSTMSPGVKIAVATESE